MKAQAQGFQQYRFKLSEPYRFRVWGANDEGGQVGMDQAAEMAGRQAGDVLEDQAFIDRAEA